jgi:hypothetical protein
MIPNQEMLKNLLSELDKESKESLIQSEIEENFAKQKKEIDDELNARNPASLTAELVGIASKLKNLVETLSKTCSETIKTYFQAPLSEEDEERIKEDKVNAYDLFIPLSRLKKKYMTSLDTIVI